MENHPTEAHEKPRRSRWWLLFVLALLVAGYVSVMILWQSDGPSVVLPNGAKVVYHSADRGKPEPGFGSGGGITYRHPSPDESKLRNAWQSLRYRAPAPLLRWMPEWSGPTHTPFSSPFSELELRFRVSGDWSERSYDIGIADEDGWETIVPDYTVPRDSSGPAWMFLDTPVPRHSKTIRVRFHPGKSTASKEEQRTVAGELVLQNPFYDGPPPAAAPAPPLTKSTRHGEITLDTLTRGPLVSDEFPDLRIAFTLRLHGKLMDEFSTSGFEITDSSKQRFHWTRWSGSRRDGHFTMSVATAPWHDDPNWIVRFEVGRTDYFPDVPEDEKLVFDHLPVPSGSGVEVNRTVGRKGLTVHISRIESRMDGRNQIWQFCLEGGYLRGMSSVTGIIIQDAQDDRGRTAMPDKPNSHIVSGPVGSNAKGPKYSVKLEPDAQWWNLTLAPVNNEPVEFQVQPAFVRTVK